jgi:hypothetical protein
MNTTIRYSTYPRTEHPPHFVEKLVSVFFAHESYISTSNRSKGLTSDEVLHILSSDLEILGFQIEKGKRKLDKIDRPVFYGENGVPTMRYQIDAYHADWKCGLEVEAGRGWMEMQSIGISFKPR